MAAYHWASRPLRVMMSHGQAIGGTPSPTTFDSQDRLWPFALTKLRKTFGARI